MPSGMSRIKGWGLVMGRIDAMIGEDDRTRELHRHDKLYQEAKRAAQVAHQSKLGEVVDC